MIRLDHNEISFPNPLHYDGHEGMIAFGEMALQWKNDGILSDNLDNTTAKSMFLNGDVAFFMNGPWEINNLKASGLNFGIAKFPDGGSGVGEV